MKSCRLLLLTVPVAFMSCMGEDRSGVIVSKNEGVDTSVVVDVDTTEIADIVDDPMESGDVEASPIEIISSKTIDGKFSKKVVIKFKNESGKTIDAVEFSWKEVDSFGSPVGESHMSGTSVEREYYIANYQHGTSDVVVKPNRTVNASFELIANDAKKVIEVEVRRVSFSDGEVWNAPGYIDLSKARFQFE